MSFFFKSKKPTPAGPASPAQLPPATRKPSSRDGTTNGTDPMNFGLSQGDDEKMRSPSRQQQFAAAQPPRVVPSPTPDSKHVVGRGNGADLVTKQGARIPQRQPPDASLYPWSTQRFYFRDGIDSNPFPRYGCSVNSISSKDGEIYMMGGLVDGNTVKGDLWIVEAGSQPIHCYQVPTTSEGPGPRVGHRSLLVGNAFIVFGGDTKMHEQDILDDTLYLLNTSSKHWSRAAPAGPRPAGRYGHTLNILGSKIYVFGGQVEGYFFNDLVAFDLNSLQGANSHWEILIQNSADGGPPQGQIPPARTNHTVITYEDKLYLFGGTDGMNWFNDVWTYDPRLNAWAQQECIGFIPAAREGHNATLVGDVMYVFGGRTDEGKDLGDVAGFRIPTRRWYTFQNMGPSPSPRSGHGMTSYGDKILVFGGEPSSAPRDPVELGEVYTLDTSKIRYPEDKAVPRSQTARRPSITDRSGTPQHERSASRDRDGSISAAGVNGRQLTARGSQDSMAENGGAYARPQEQVFPSAAMNGAPVKGARIGPSPIPAGPPPQQPTPQPRVNGVRNISSPVPGRESPRPGENLDRVVSPEPSGRERMASPTFSQSREVVNGPSPTTGYYASPREAPRENNFTSAPGPTVAAYNHQQQGSADSTRRMTETPEAGARADDLIQSNFKYPNYADSGVGSSPALSTQQNDNASRELESARSKNAWYATELALARKAGYGMSSAESPSSIADDRTVDAFGDEERPLLEALLRMRAELAKMQDALGTQSSSAAERIAQTEREKDAAISEATYHKTQLASRGLPMGGDMETSARLEEANRRLASTLAARSGLEAQIQSLSQALEAERNARETAEESANAAHSRAADLDTHKQQSTSELEALRAQLHVAEKNGRDNSSTHADTLSTSKLMEVDNRELSSKLTAAQEAQRSHSDVLRTLRDSMTSSQQKTSLLERQVEQERQQRSTIEEKLALLRAEHESRVSELDTATRKLQDAQELAEHHANEAQTHREAVLAGLGKDVDRGIDPMDANDDRVDILQQRLNEANLLTDRHREAANSASERLRSAEERIAGLESYQEQSSREGLSLRKQLQTSSRDAIARQSEHAEVSRQLDQHKLDIAGWQAQNHTLRSILSDRGFDTSQLPTDISAYQTSASTSTRIQQLEEQLASASSQKDELRSAYEKLRGQNESTDKEVHDLHLYIAKCQDVVEKMKGVVTEEKTKNQKLREQLERSRSSTPNAAEVESERANMRGQIEALHSRVQLHQSSISTHLSNLQAATTDRDSARDEARRYQAALQDTHARSTTDLAALRQQNTALEARATEAEKKVQMLLDTIGSSVDTYRRQSGTTGLSTAQVAGLSTATANGLSHSPSNSLSSAHYPGPLTSFNTAAFAPPSHSRGLSLASIGAESTYSSHGAGGGLDSPGTADNRDSTAYEGMLSELERMRNDWAANRETYAAGEGGASERGSTMLGGEGVEGGAVNGVNGFGGGLASWRRGLRDEDEDGDEDDEEDENGGASASAPRGPALVAATAAAGGK